MDINDVAPISRRDRDICLVDSATTHTILKDKEYFSSLTLLEAKVNTISGSVNLIEGSGRATILLASGTKLTINEALYSSKSRRNLLSFKDIRLNRFHVETTCENKTEFLCIISKVSGQKLIVEKLEAFSSGLYYTYIKPIEIYAVMNQKFNDPKTFMLWHDRLGNPGSTMMRRIIENTNGHQLKN